MKFIPHPTEYSSSEEWICSMYRAGVSMKAIAERLNVGVKVISSVIKEANSNALLAFRSRVVS